jgi:hypothetical protein
MGDIVPNFLYLHFFARYSAAELNGAGDKLLDNALEGAVEITRGKQRFVLIRRDQLLRLIEDVRTDCPRSLGDLLRGYDAGKINKRARGFLDDEPTGKELI